MYAELRELVVAEGLLERAYGYYAWRGLLSLGILVAGIVTSHVLYEAIPLNALLLAFGSVQVALIGHDAGHLAIFATRRANHALGTLTWSLLLGIGFQYWNDRHIRHHSHTNHLQADPDLQWVSMVAYTEDALQSRTGNRWLVRNQAWLGPLYTLGLAFAFRVEGWRFALLRRDRLELGALLVSAVAWLLPTLWVGWAWLPTYVLGQLFAGLYLALAIAPNHKGMPTWSSTTPPTFLEHQVLSSRNVLPHPLTDFVFGGLNYQIEHHLFPTMPRVRFARARRLVKPFCQRHGIPYEEMGAFASYRLVLAELQRVAQLAAR